MENNKIQLDELERAIKLAGSQGKLGKICGTTQGTVWSWLHRNKKIPAEQVIPIEKGLDGKIKRHEMRPDIYPPEEYEMLQLIRAHNLLGKNKKEFLKFLKFLRKK